MCPVPAPAVRYSLEALAKDARATLFIPCLVVSLHLFYRLFSIVVLALSNVRITFSEIDLYFMNIN
jgi:hypothetical protein